MSKDNIDKQSDEEIYQQLIKGSIDQFKDTHSLTEKNQQQIIRSGKFMAQKTNIMISLAILLLILPVLTLATYVYYGIGGKANRLIDVAAKTVYVTEPNMRIKQWGVNIDIGLFSMDMDFSIYKKIGNEEYKVANYDVPITFSQTGRIQREAFLDREVTTHDKGFMYPRGRVPYTADLQWNVLKGLPDGTVSEIYISLANVMSREEFEKLLPQNIDLRWLAVDTGLEGRTDDQSGTSFSAIGYPAQVDANPSSPFSDKGKTNEVTFLEVLKLLREYEPQAEKMAGVRNLSLTKRIQHIEQNGIKIYGAVLTGPTAQLRQLEQVKEIRGMKVGEVKLWN
ncbi:anti-sigma factor C-terminal domain-containing protein [Paenibacillus sp. N1-5-1-14]|uniref:anti-sigma factor C-terminal domain-containing protein n=1 Tax=Paenibacillus radicibacter TaxID=2972488 RepID=UPI002158E434|nr:anti-sigma factor C-terminal domain-containing protein [Paenibacillus radicibacter]MCR8643317.1 anti-sigma factor C-terminal domain-containing protein [Paenibacillus radicibacter]